VAGWLGLQGTASLEQILDEVHRSPSRAPRVAEGILSALAG